MSSYQSPNLSVSHTTHPSFVRYITCGSGDNGPRSIGSLEVLAASDELREDEREEGKHSAGDHSCADKAQTLLHNAHTISCEVRNMWIFVGGCCPKRGLIT